MAATTLTPGDIAIIGYITNGTPDSFSIVNLAPIGSGTVIYFTDNGWTGTAFRGSSATDGDGNENLIRFTAVADIPAGTVIRTTDTSANFTWTTSGTIGTTTSGSYANLALSATAEQIAAFQSTNTSNPLNSGFTGIFQIDDTGTFENATDAATGNLLPGLTQAANTAVLFNSATTSQTFNLSTVPSSGTTKADWLAAINNSANWTFGSATTLPTTTTNLTVTAASLPTVSLGVSTNAGTEIGTTIITVTATASSAVVGNQTVNIGVAGTGITTGDYTLSANQITILGGAATGSVTFTVVDDILIEGLETAALTISTPSSGITLGSTVTQNITITDNDAPTISISVVGNSFSEAAGNGAALGTVTRNVSAFDLLTSLQVNVTSSDLSEVTIGNPLFPNPGIVTIAAGQTFANFSVNAVDDTIVDGSQSVVLTASATGFVNSTANLTVTDNDVLPTVSIAAQVANAAEGSTTPGVFRISRTGGDIASALTVNYGVGGTATSADYNQTLGTSVMIAANALFADVNITPFDDVFVEGSETVNLTLMNNVSYLLGGGYNSNSAVVTIADNDFLPTVSIAAQTINTAEGSTTPGVFRITRTTTDTSSALTVNYGVTNLGVTGTASPSDYSETLTGTATIAIGQTYADITITPLDDSFVEGPETVSLALTSGAGYNLSVPTAATVTIADNDVSPTTTTTRNDFNNDKKSDILLRNGEQLEIWQMDGTTITPASAILSSVLNTDWKVASTGDFNSDSKADILWRNDTNGEVQVWQMDGTTLTTSTTLGWENTNGVPITDWKIAGTGDFNNDQKSDILWRHDDGRVAIWQMDGTAITSASAGIATVATTWKIAGTGDFNGDSKSDILWRNDDGSVAIWQMDGTTITPASAIIANPGTDWRIAGTGDFNGDSKSDILWRNDDGSVAIWQMDGTTITPASAIIANPGTDWKISGTGDFNGDSNADILWRNDLGSVAIWQMDGTTITPASAILSSVPTTDWKIAAPIL
jgi:FG-GAP-like repeat/Calx-beta domain